MNRRELDAMRDRLAARSAAIEEDSPLLLWVGAILWAVVVILFCFL